MSDTPNTPKPEDDLGAAGQKALQQERAARREAERRAQDAEEKLAKIEADGLRATVAAERGLTDAQAKRLQGTTREELEADADELLSAFQPAEETSTSRRPRERLRPGAIPSSTPERSMGDVAADVLGN